MLSERSANIFLLRCGKRLLLFLNNRFIHMKKIMVEDIADTMVLAKDVCGPSGNILLSTGTVLTAAMGRRLKNWGIHVVHIESEEEPVPRENVPRISHEEITSMLKNKFSNVMDNQLMKKIFASAAQYKIQKGSG
jgi:hypothetical protein